MVLESSEAIAHPQTGAADAGDRPGSPPSPRLRGLPYRLARRRRRADGRSCRSFPAIRSSARCSTGTRFEPGTRIGVPWLGWTCGECRYCLDGRENLCDRARFTGYDLDGGYAELAVADERFYFLLPEGYADEAGGCCSAEGSSVSRAPARGRCRDGRPVRVRSFCSHRLSGRRVARAKGAGTRADDRGTQSSRARSGRSGR